MRHNERGHRAGTQTAARRELICADAGISRIEAVTATLRLIGTVDDPSDEDLQLSLEFLTEQLRMLAEDLRDVVGGNSRVPLFTKDWNKQFEEDGEIITFDMPLDDDEIIRITVTAVVEANPWLSEVNASKWVRMCWEPGQTVSQLWRRTHLLTCRCA